jgi:hypothetical protein
MLVLKLRKIAKRTPVLDHADEVLYYADRAKVEELIGKPGVEVIGTTTRIKGLRYVGPDPALSLLSGSSRRPGVEKPHRRETYWNPAGVLTFNFLSIKLRPEFNRVLESCVVHERRNNVVEMPRQIVAHPLQRAA